MFRPRYVAVNAWQLGQLQPLDFSTGTAD
jgi:hypothetical protein